MVQRVWWHEPGSVEAAVALFAVDANQHLVPMFGNVDSDQLGRKGRLSSSHSRSPQQCLCAKPMLGPEARLWPPATQFKGCAGGHNLPSALLPDALRDRVYRQKAAGMDRSSGAKTVLIAPGSPWEKGYCESFNARFRNELLNGQFLYSLREAQILIERRPRH